MKQILFIIFFLSNLIGYSQTTEFKQINHRQLYRYDYFEIDFDFEGCNKEEEVKPIVLIEIHAVDPEAPIAEKEKRILELDVLINSLKILANCPETHTIILQLGEALFLKEEYNENGFRHRKKDSKTNADYFWARYQTTFEKILPGKTILLYDWNW